MGSAFLDRERAKIRVKPLTDLATPMLVGIVDFGCAIYAVCLLATKGKDLHRPSLALYRHVLEMTDAIQVLIANSCVQPLDLLLRSALEAEMSLEYLLVKDYEHRSLVWSYYYLRKTKRQYDPANPDTKKWFRNYGPQEQAELDRITRRIESEVYADLHETLKNSRVPNNWFQWVLDDGESGPANNRALSRRLTQTRKTLGKKYEKYDLEGIYVTAYKPYSRTVHADINPYINELRHPEGIQDCILQTAFVANYCIHLMIEKFILNEERNNFQEVPRDFEEWHKQIKVLMDEIKKVEIYFKNGGPSG